MKADLFSSASKLPYLANQLMTMPSNPARNAHPTTPSLPLSDHINHFARTLSADEPVMVPYLDVHSGYISGACHLNVAHRVKNHGGERVFGWMIWTSASFTEGEFHSVWRSPKGELEDITPRKDGEKFVLFVPDPNTQLEARGKGAMIPSNRTTFPGMPYALGAPVRYVEPDQRTRNHMAKLGFSHMTGAQ